MHGRPEPRPPVNIVVKTNSTSEWTATWHEPIDPRELLALELSEDAEAPTHTYVLRLRRSRDKPRTLRLDHIQLFEVDTIEDVLEDDAMVLLTLNIDDSSIDGLFCAFEALATEYRKRRTA